MKTQIDLLTTKLGSQILSKNIYNLMNAAQKLEMYAPTTVFYESITQQYQNPCRGRAYIVSYPNEEIQCEINSANLPKPSELMNEESYVAKWDYRYPSTSLDLSKVPILILHGIPGSTSFCELHQTLSTLSHSNQINYIFRPAFPGMNSISTHRPLQGYGVYLDIKNMEYKNVDDKDDNKKDSEISSNQEIQFEKDEEVKGLIFSTLQERRPELSKELAMLREEILSSTSESVNADGVTEMKVWKMMDLGLQATQAIISSPDPVRTMNEILLNFPKHAPSLSSSRVTTELKDAMSWWLSGPINQIPSNSLFINGVRVDLDRPTFNIFSLIGTLHKEFNNIEYLNSRNLPKVIKKSIIDLARTLNEKKSRGPVPDIVRVDVSKGGKNAIYFLNNLEKDSMYKRLPRSVNTLMQPSWSLHAIQKNLYTLIAIVDPTSTAGTSLLYQLNSIYQQQYPIRIGVALTCEQTQASSSSPDQVSSADVCRLFAATKDLVGTQGAFTFLFGVSNAIQEKAEELFVSTGVSMSAADLTASVKDAYITQDALLKIYGENIAQLKNSWATSKKYITEGKSILLKQEYTDFLTNSTLYCKMRGLLPNSFALNGIVRNSYDISSDLMQLLGREQYIIATMVRKGDITDSTKSIYAALLEESKTYSRYHPVIDETSPRYMNPKDGYFTDLSHKTTFFTNRLDHEECTIPDQENNQFGMFNTTFIFFPISKHGVESALSGLKWLNSTYLSDESVENSSNEERASPVCSLNSIVSFSHAVGLIPTNLLNPTHESSLWFSLISHLTQNSCRHHLSPSPTCGRTELNMLIDLFELYMTGTSVDESIQQLKIKYSLHPTIHSLPDNWSTSALVSPLSQELEHLALKSLYQDVREEDDTTIVYNGRLFRITTTNKPYLDLDFDLIHDIEQSRLGLKLSSLLMRSELSSFQFNGFDFLTLACFCGTYATTSGGRVNVEEIIKSFDGDTQSNILQIHPLYSAEDVEEGEEGDEEGKAAATSDLSLIYIFNPLSQGGQRAATLIQYVQKELKLPQRIVLTPDPRISEFPLQNFYRFVAGESSIASFKNLPKQHTLTIRMDPPEAWNVQSYKAIQDIDNLKCSLHRCGDQPGHPSELTSVSYIVKNLLIAGQCFEGMQYNPTPPNGLQLVLSKSSTGKGGGISHYSDTLVMQNLGYFQLQANPGLWQLNLAEGRAHSLYLIDSTNENPLKDEKGAVYAVSIPIRSFTDKIMHLTVSKRPGMEHMSLLDSDNEGGAGHEVKSSSSSSSASSMWNSISGMFGLNGKPKETDNRIHVFSLATGQVYERLLRIMMLSVVKRTSVPVKFWLFEYYLSPSFKATVTAMQLQYGFEVGYVMYKWPEWLTQQTVKQRIIWGYKILFLDVLFPLDVKKVIYVDSDQVVRGDLKELWDMDLEGKPYAYTPFCSTREETLGFQFWRQGYWADHLRGKPYHISALYVVDLQVFRQQAIGDRLRGVYDSLAKDPNSLANLDQDLPNYAQHVVPIHSLPQEWLWCETWCSEKSKKAAKTIDLCNNPLHKEPKLDMARRVINGTLFKESWVELDEEIKQVIVKANISLLD